MKKTEHEITQSDIAVIGDVYIGTGETDGIRLPTKDIWGVLMRKDSPPAPTIEVEIYMIRKRYQVFS